MRDISPKIFGNLFKNIFQNDNIMFNLYPLYLIFMDFTSS